MQWMGDGYDGGYSMDVREEGGQCSRDELYHTNGDDQDDDQGLY